MAGKRYWASKVPVKDDFGDVIGDEFIDGRANHGTAWGLFTPKSWHHYGCGRLGQGFGQRYVRDETDKFAKVEG